MIDKTTGTTVMSATKFDLIAYTEKRLLIINTKKEIVTVLFSDLNKVYIKKNKLSFLTITAIFSVFLLFLAVSSLFIPFELVLAASILLIPLLVKLNTFKWYQLNVLLNNGDLIKKTFNTKKKYEYINLVNAIRSEVFFNRIESNIQSNESLKSKTFVNEYPNQTLSIA